MRPAATPETAAPTPLPAERVVARLRRHARILILPAVLLILVAGVATYAIAIAPEPWQDLAIGGVAAVVVLFGCFLPFHLPRCTPSPNSGGASNRLENVRKVTSARRNSLL